MMESATFVKSLGSLLCCMVRQTSATSRIRQTNSSTSFLRGTLAKAHTSLHSNCSRSAFGAGTTSLRHRKGKLPSSFTQADFQPRKLQHCSRHSDNSDDGLER